MAGKEFGAIRVDGLREFQRAVRRGEDRDLPKRLGRAHREVGVYVIARLQPKPVPEAVGAGAGATVRPSASKREVLLRVGGTHRRNPPLSTWGRRTIVLAAGRRRPPRPYIRETADRHQRAIERVFLRSVTAAMNGAFHSTSP